MNLWQRFWSWLNAPTRIPLGGQNIPQQDVPRASGVASTATRAPGTIIPVSSPLPSGRASLDTAYNYNYADKTILPPPDHESEWRFHDLDTKHLDYFSPMQVLDSLLEISPDVSRAAWDFNRLCNPGWECKAYVLGTEKTEDPAGTEWVKNLMLTLRNLYGSPDIVIGRYYMGAFMRGGFCGEIVLGPDARETVDLVAPDPFSIRFRKITDPIRGPIWQPGQMQKRNFVPLDIPTFRYLPIDPAPASPYGRSLAAPALFTTLFILSILHDVKRVIMQQGYKRMDIELDMELAQDAYTYDQQGYASLGEYVRAAMDAVKAAYKTLQPDDAFIHTSIFKLQTPAGTIDSDSLGAITDLISLLEKRVARALKSNSLLMDMESSPNETDSNRRWEIHAAGVKSLQHHCEHMLEALLGVGLQAAGIQARIEFRFSELRAAEMFRDEQTMAMRIQNARELYNAGYSSQEESSNYAINHNPDVAEPRNQTGDLDFKEDNSSGNEELKKDEKAGDRVVTRVLERLVDILKFSGTLEREAPGNLNRSNGNDTH